MCKNLIKNVFDFLMCVLGKYCFNGVRNTVEGGVVVVNGVR